MRKHSLGNPLSLPCLHCRGPETEPLENRFLSAVQGSELWQGSSTSTPNAAKMTLGTERWWWWWWWWVPLPHVARLLCSQSFFDAKVSMWKCCKTGRQRGKNLSTSDEAVPSTRHLAHLGFGSTSVGRVYEISSLSVSIRIPIPIRIRIRFRFLQRLRGGWGSDAGVGPAITYMSCRYHLSGSIFNSRLTSSGRRRRSVVERSQISKNRKPHLEI